MSWAHLTQTQTIKSRKSTDWSSVHAWKAAFWLLSTATLCYYSLRGILWPHPSRPGSCRVRRSAGWPTRSRRWCTRTRWPSRTAQLQKRRVLQGDLWDCGWLETAVTSQSALWAIHSRQKENVSLTYKRIITINWILHTCNTNNVVDNKGCTKEDGSVVQCVVGAFFTRFLAGFFIFTHLAIFLPVTQPLHRDAQVVVTAKLVVWAVCLTAFLQLNTAKNIKDTSSVQQPDCFLLSPLLGGNRKRHHT